MDLKKILRISFWVLIFAGTAARTAYSQPPATSSPALGIFQSPGNPASTLEQSQQFAEAIDSPKHILRALTSVPWIGVTVQKLDFPFFDDAYGSAVVVGNGTGGAPLVFTAAHVFPPYRDLVCATGTRVTIHFYAGDVAGRVIYLNKANDLAIVRLESSSIPLMPSLKIAEKDPEVGEELFALGYPPVTSSLQTVVKVRFRGVDVYTAQFQTTPHVFVQLEVQRFILLNGAEVGYSGGALLNKRGEVQGILSQLSPHGSFMFAIGRKHLQEALATIRTGSDFCQK